MGKIQLLGQKRPDHRSANSPESAYIEQPAGPQKQGFRLNFDESQKQKSGRAHLFTFAANNPDSYSAEATGVASGYGRKSHYLRLAHEELPTEDSLGHQERQMPDCGPPNTSGKQEDRPKEQSSPKQPRRGTLPNSLENHARETPGSRVSSLLFRPSLSSARRALHPPSTFSPTLTSA